MSTRSEQRGAVANERRAPVSYLLKGVRVLGGPATNLLLRDGVIAGVGTHSELLATNRDYAAVLSATEVTA